MTLRQRGRLLRGSPRSPLRGSGYVAPLPAGCILRDVLGRKYVAEHWDNDWLIFKSGPSEMGVHPTHSVWKGQSYDHPRHHLIALMCDDIERTCEELRAKGAQFRGSVEEREYGASS